ncbi:uncharacterized protein TrAtP1_011459 [Trichoderma atroviride]|uniref:uncharacterized protein n=1 Tax=Hypocrea atroviridis TaxID=63577 RepID=UPI00331C55A5|nr:hypothetical protein TrAtP1_011459 [Trichoderma atroviride]
MKRLGSMDRRQKSLSPVMRVEREAEFANDPDPEKMRCKKRITLSQGTCKHRKRGQQIKYRPPPRGSPGCAAIGPLFLSPSGARAAESLCVCCFQGSLLC